MNGDQYMNINNRTCCRREFIRKSSTIMAGLPFSNAVFNSRNTVESRAVPTLSGNIRPGRLGTTLMHEHVLFGNIPDNLREPSREIAIKMLEDAADAGVQTLVDVTPWRDIHLYQEIAEKTRVQIIASTGYYVRDRMPEYLRNMTELQMEQRMLKEVTEGIGNTRIRAGIIKIAADSPRLNDFEMKVFRAAIRVQKATKVPIATHAWTGVRDQFDFLLKNGADMSHVNFSHIETTPGWEGRSRTQMAEIFLPILQHGAYLLFNNFSCEFYTLWEDMIYLIRHFCDKGHSNRILISEDCNWEWKNGKQVFEAQEEHPEAAERTYAYMLTHEVPRMLKSGFTRAEIQTFLVDNPRRYFTIDN